MKYTIFQTLMVHFEAFLLKKICDLHFFLQFSDFSFIHQRGHFFICFTIWITNCFTICFTIQSTICFTTWTINTILRFCN